MSPVSLALCKQLGRKRLLPSWWTMQIALHTVRFSYTFAVKEILYVEKYPRKLRIFSWRYSRHLLVGAFFGTKKSEKVLFFFNASTPKKGGAVYRNKSPQCPRQEKFLLWNSHVTMIKEGKQKRVKAKLCSYNVILTLIHTLKILRCHRYSTLTIKTMLYATNFSLDKLNSTDFVDYGNCHDRFRPVPW